MRKKRIWGVFFLVSLIILMNSMDSIAGDVWAAAAPSCEKSQTGVYFSLEEALAEPGRPALLVFFSLSCHVCWDELFEMKEFIEKYNIPVELIGIAREEPEELRAFAARYSFDHPVVHDRKKELYRRFKVKLEPHRVILEKNRIIYEDDRDLDFITRRERAKQCLLAIASR